MTSDFSLPTSYFQVHPVWYSNYPKDRGRTRCMPALGQSALDISGARWQVTPMFAFLNLGPFELVLIFLVILLLFGAKRLPELARGLGKSINEFKKASSSAEEEIRQAIHTEAPPPAPKAAPAAQEAPKA